jgi:hypothetical protein
MRTFGMTSILLATLLLGTSATSAAPWCSVYGGALSGSQNCGFYSYQQCMANVSGIGGFCRRNAFEDRHTSNRRYRHRQ